MKRSLTLRRQHLPFLLLALAYLAATAPLLWTDAGSAIRIAPQLDAVPADRSPLNAPPAPAAAFAALEARAAAPLRVAYHPVSGVAEFVAASSAAGRLPYTPTDIERGNPLAIARGFLDQNRALFGLRSAADELSLLRVEPDLRLGFQHIRLAQSYRGLPVFGRQLVVHLDGDEQIVAVNGQFTPAVELPTEPAISPEQALDVALANLRNEQLQPFELARAAITPVPADTRLMVYVDGEGRASLVYEVVVLTASPLSQWQFFVDALRPAVVHAIDGVMPIKRRQTYSANNSTRIPGRLVIDEGERSRDQVAQAAHDGAGLVYDYYFNTFQRDSIDGRGLPLVSTVHYGSDPQDAENAAWVGEYAQMIYGDGGQIFEPLPFGLDVVGHEFTHGVIDASAQLIYEGQPGALNESYADVFGAMIDRDDWDIGEDVIKSPPFPTAVLRSLEDPNLGLYDPRNPLQGVGQPASMDEYANLPNSRRADNGGVHINSGIPNRAAFLIASAIGRERFEQIAYRALTQYLTPDSDFLDAANATLRAAQDLYGDELTAQVQAGYDQVGITTNPTPDTPPIPAEGDIPNIPPTGPDQNEPLPAGCRDVIVNGGFESDEAWVQVATGDVALIDPELPRSGRRSAWLGGQDQEALQYIYQDVRIPGNATRVELRYARLLHEEFADLLGIFSAEANFTVALANTNGDTLGTLAEYASSQGDDTWQDEAFDMSRQAGKTVRLVFAAENPRGNISSLFIDDVQLIACTTGAGPAAPPTSNADLVYVQGQILDANTGRGVEGAQVFVLRPGVSASQAAADDNLSAEEVLTFGTTDRSGVYQTEQAVPRNQAYSFIIVARGYRPILADGEVNIPADAANPYRVDAQLRRR
jgi:bacillolysin/thermolysin/neutral peptidase B